MKLLWFASVLQSQKWRCPAQRKVPVERVEDLKPSGNSPLLPHEDGVAVQVAHVHRLAPLLDQRVGCEHQPANVREPEAPARVMRVRVRLAVLVVHSMIQCPRVDMPLHTLKWSLVIVQCDAQQWGFLKTQPTPWTKGPHTCTYLHLVALTNYNQGVYKTLEVKFIVFTA